MSSTSALWFRTFVRSSANDIDTVASPQFLTDNFTDFFGKWLQEGQHSSIFTLNELLLAFYDNSAFSFTIYCVADGAFIPHPDPGNPSSWFNPHVRFVAVVQPNPLGNNPFTLFIVGSNELRSEKRFVQVVSWDNTINEYRYYGKEEVQPGGEDPTEGVWGWVYQGRSSYAFTPDTSYLGPFNGHVNGALVMKELEKPWYHWKSGENPNLPQCFTTAERTEFKVAPYLSYNTLLFSEVADANKLQGAIQGGINAWYSQRAILDFPEVAGGVAPPERLIQRWMSHVLLTTTINISVAAVNPNQPVTAWFAPTDHFVNNMMLKLSAFSDLLPEIPKLAFTKITYNAAVDALNINLIQENITGEPIPPPFQNLVAQPGTLGGGKETDEHEVLNFVVVQKGEGVPFVILQPSYEDAQGAQKMQSVAKILSEETFNALMMVDICNPVYSWRRGVLMQYVPQTTTWDTQAGKYDLEDNFIKSVQASKYAADSTMPEYQFLQLRGDSVSTHRQKISQYLSAVAARLNTTDGLTEYLTLAESRRRIYRPLPLDEFGYTLPYALNYTPTQPLEMTLAGTTQTMPERGIKFLESWTGTLWGNNPELIPVGPSLVRAGVRCRVGASVADLRVRHIPCDGNKRFRKTSGCPFASKLGKVQSLRYP